MNNAKNRINTVFLTSAVFMRNILIFIKIAPNRFDPGRRQPKGLVFTGSFLFRVAYRVVQSSKNARSPSHSFPSDGLKVYAGTLLSGRDPLTILRAS